jgi:hypothetical protein
LKDGRWPPGLRPSATAGRPDGVSRKRESHDAVETRPSPEASAGRLPASTFGFRSARARGSIFLIGNSEDFGKKPFNPGAIAPMKDSPHL